MSEKTSRRSLLQKTALAAGAAALITNKASAQEATSEPSPLGRSIFPAGFRNEKIKTTGAEINAVIGGSGPPVLLFHGAPQSLVTWHLVAPDLAKDYTLVMCDLRGYGDSSRPPDAPDHSSQSKRPMALDGVEVMEHLGFRKFQHGRPRSRGACWTPHGARSSGSRHQTRRARYRAGALALLARDHRVRAGVLPLVQLSASGARSGRRTARAEHGTRRTRRPWRWTGRSRRFRRSQRRRPERPSRPHGRTGAGRIRASQ